MKPMNERDPFKIGLIALAIGALVGAGVVVLSVVNFGTSSYTAVLEHTGGLLARTLRADPAAPTGVSQSAHRHAAAAG